MTLDNKNKSLIKKIAGILFPLIIMVLFLYFAFNNVDLAASVTLISEASLSWILIFILFFLLSHFLRAYRWQVIIHSVKSSTSITNMFGAVMVGYGVNCVIPRLGELYRALYLGRWENLSRSSMLGTIIVERVIDLLALGISVLISVLIYPGNLLNEISWLKSTLFFGFGGIFTLILFLFLIVRFKEKFYNGIIIFIGKLNQKIADKIAHIFHMLTEGFSTVKGFKNYFKVVLLTCIIMLLIRLRFIQWIYDAENGSISGSKFQYGMDSYDCKRLWNCYPYTGRNRLLPFYYNFCAGYCIRF